MGHVTILTGPERRRHWSDEDRFRILEQAFAPGAVVAEVARRHDVSRTLIYLWRRQLLAEASAPAFMPAVIVEDAPSAASESPAIVLELPDGRKVSIFASASPALAAAALKVLR